MGRKKVLISVLLVTAIAGIFIYSQSKTERDKTQVLSENNSNAYESLEFGLFFRYPEHYFLEEKELSNAERRHKSVILTEDTEENRLVKEGKSPGREGPVAIVIDIYLNNPDRLPLKDWVLNNNQSNYKLDGRDLIETTLSGKSALSYSWSGLYEGDTVVFEHKDNIMAASVTYITKEDPIRSDFEKILKTIKLDK